MKKEKIISAGVGIAALAVLGAYFLGGKRGARNRDLVKGWTLKMKGEVLDRIEKVKKLDKKDYEKIVDGVSARYAKLEKVGGEELKRLTAEMKRAWGHISKELN